MTQVPAFAVVSGAQVHEAVAGREEEVTRMVEAAYRLHGEGLTVNPDSYFLRFPDRPSDRIIALPASVKGDVGVHGIKWISSFPGNVANASTYDYPVRFKGRRGRRQPPTHRW